MKRQNTRRGFTLIELLVVVLIIGILAAVALPQYQKAVKRAKYAEMLSIITPLANAVKHYYMENGVYPTSIDQLPINISHSNGYIKKGIYVYLTEVPMRLYVTDSKGGRASNGYIYQFAPYEGVRPTPPVGLFCFQAPSWGHPDGMCSGGIAHSDAYGILHYLQ